MGIKGVDKPPSYVILIIEREVIKVLEKVKEYFESEYADTVRAIERKYNWGTPKSFVERAITDCLAVAMFAQTLGISFEEVNLLYNEYKSKLENLLA